MARIRAVCAALLLGGLLAAQPARAAEKAESKERTVIVINRGETAKAQVGDVIRVRGMVPSGQGDISATVSGPGKLIATSVLRRFDNGNPAIGAHVKEFEVRAQKAGTVKIVVTVDNKVQKMKTDKEYSIEVE